MFQYLLQTQAQLPTEGEERGERREGRGERGEGRGERRGEGRGERGEGRRERGGRMEPKVWRCVTCVYTCMCLVIHALYCT